MTLRLAEGAERKRYATMKRVASILFTTLIVCAWDVRPQAASTTTPTIDQWLSLKTILKKEASPHLPRRPLSRLFNSHAGLGDELIRRPDMDR